MKTGTTIPRQSIPNATHFFQRRFPIGAELLAQSGVHFRVWAPQSRAVALLLSHELEAVEADAQIYELNPEPDGYFSGYVPDATAGMFYKFRLSSGTFPDPASRFQPLGPHGPSQIIDPGTFLWTDQEWPGVWREGQVIYEMHLGTFTPEGTWRAAMEQLPELAHLGITVIELMPLADFSGSFGWGYDGVDLFAPTRLYGTPDEARAFVDRAHALGLGVMLDVVYNHFGPDGCYLREFSSHYVTNLYKNEWGEAINFDGEQSGPVREFFITNAVYWVNEFHFDGFRFDATQQIFDQSPEHILAAISREVQKSAGARAIYFAAENEVQDNIIVRRPEQGGYGFDALWNDDFHHTAWVALTGRNEAYYSDYRGTPQELISAMKWGWLYHGQWYSWQKKRRGTPTFEIEPSQFINFLQNHDQVANSLRGQRMTALANPALCRALTALLLLGPGTPMLFQGQEFAASNPFLYFADHNPELAKLVSAGRKEFLSQFPSSAAPDAAPVFADPGAEETFHRCKLNFAERASHAHSYHLHRDLLRLRREDPIFARPRPRGLDGAVLSQRAFVLRFFGAADGDRLLLVNLGFDLHLQVQPEPLLAPLEGRLWRVKWSSENPIYGGNGTPPIDTPTGLHLPGFSAIVMEPECNDCEVSEQRKPRTYRRTA